MTRGDIVTVAMTGDVGKPRPALVVQADPFDQTGTITVLLLSGTLVDAPLIRLIVRPTPQNGLLKPSQIQIDKAMSVQRHKVGAVIGRLDDASMPAVTRGISGSSIQIASLSRYRAAQKRRQYQVKDDCWPQKDAGQTTCEANVSKIHRDGCAVGQHPDQWGAGPAGDP